MARCRRCGSERERAVRLHGVSAGRRSKRLTGGDIQEYSVGNMSSSRPTLRLSFDVGRRMWGERTNGLRTDVATPIPNPFSADAMPDSAAQAVQNALPCRGAKNLSPLMVGKAAGAAPSPPLLRPLWGIIPSNADLDEPKASWWSSTLSWRNVVSAQPY